MTKSHTSARVVAFCGKGGVGKTTITAIAAGSIFFYGRARAAGDPDGPSILVVDADPAGGLSLALGIAPHLTLTDVRALVAQEARSTDRAPVTRRDLERALDYHLLDALSHRSSVAFLALGRPRSQGCFCAVNSLLRQALAQLSIEFQLTLLDAEAGIEQVNREVLDRVDTLVLLSDLSIKGLSVAETIRELATKERRVQRVGLLLNRVRDEGEARAAAARTDLPLWGWVPEDDTIRDFDSQARSFLELPDTPARRAVAAALAAAGVLFPAPGNY